MVTRGYARRQRIWNGRSRTWFHQQVHLRVQQSLFSETSLRMTQGLHGYLSRIMLHLHPSCTGKPCQTLQGSDCFREDRDIYIHHRKNVSLILHCISLSIVVMKMLNSPSIVPIINLFILVLDTRFFHGHWLRILLWCIDEFVVLYCTPRLRNQSEVYSKQVALNVLPNRDT